MKCLGGVWPRDFRQIQRLSLQFKKEQGALQVQVEAEEISPDDLTQIRVVSANDLLTPAGAPKAFAPVLEVMRLHLGFTLRSNQIECALSLLRGECVELRTGEGKTLAAGLAALVAARSGVSVHVITVNDYLAARDCEIIVPFAEALGLQISVLQQDMQDDEKSRAYDADIVYGTNKTFVFDHLRDLREKRLNEAAIPRQMGQALGIVDEADSVLIDDATVPMILSEPAADVPEMDQNLFQALVAIVQSFQPDLEIARDAAGNWRLTPFGIEVMGAYAQKLRHPIAEHEDLLGVTEQALQATRGFKNEVHYVVVDDELQLIDQATGRIMPDRRWGYGMHQMVEIAAGLKPTSENRTVGQITQQTYFRQYRVLSGLTGTANECRGELWSIYKLAVRPIAPHAPSLLKDLGLNVFRFAVDKWEFIADEALRLSEGRAVLVGLNDVAEASALRAVFARRGRDIRVLDALTEAEEAKIVADAGQIGQITVATHLAGRGTDIKLANKVRADGGLHVIIGSSMASGRLERQLFGRAGRQGDPGSYQIAVSLEDRGLKDGAFSTLRRLMTLALRMRLFSKLALSSIQSERDRKARVARRRSLLREQDLAQQLGYK